MEGENSMELYIKGRREGYSLEQCRKTMTVGQLIECLKNYDMDTLVYLRNNDGYGYTHIYGSITTDSFNDSEDEEEDEEE